MNQRPAERNYSRFLMYFLFTCHKSLRPELKTRGRETLTSIKEAFASIPLCESQTESSGSIQFLLYHTSVSPATTVTSSFLAPDIFVSREFFFLSPHPFLHSHSWNIYLVLIHSCVLWWSDVIGAISWYSSFSY